MGVLTDGQVVFLKESSWDSPATPSRALEVLPDGTSHAFDPMVIQGMGLRVGSQYMRGARRLAGTGRGEITVKYELESKGFGSLFELLGGSCVSNLVSTGVYQELCLPTITSAFQTSATFQFGVPESDASGTVTPFTYSGCCCKSFEIDAPDMESPPTVTATFWAADVTTGTALVAASYPSTPTLFSGAAAATTLAGSLTMPTTTALASGGTSVTDIRGWNLSVDLGLAERPALGGWQQPALGAPKATLKIKQDYDATTLQALLLSQGSVAFTGTYTGGTLTSGSETFQVAVPAAYVDDGALAQFTAGDPAVPEITLACLDDLSHTPWAIAIRTADTAL